MLKSLSQKSPLPLAKNIPGELAARPRGQSPAPLRHLRRWCRLSDAHSYPSMKYIIASLFILLSTAAWAEDIAIEDAYARVSRPGAPTGAIFMVIQNSGNADDILVAAASPIAKRVELHTHIMEDDVMRMRPIEGGIKVAAKGTHALERGGDHVMLMGLTELLEDGMRVELTLTFENAGEVVTMVPVDNLRGQSGHGN